jgi:hypothetical protein
VSYARFVIPSVGDFAIRTDPLTRPVSAAERKRVRPAPAPGATQRRLVTVGSYGVTALVLLGVCIYLVGADLQYVPIVVVIMAGCAVYAAITGVRRHRRTSVEGYRLDLLASENELELARDVVDPDTPGSLFRVGSGRRLALRLRQTHPLFVEVGRYCATASPLDGGGAIDIGYLLVHDAEAARRWAANGEVVAPPSAPAPPTDGLRELSALPTVVVEGLPAPLRVETDGDFVILYSPEPFALGLATTWRALAEAVLHVRS